MDTHNENNEQKSKVKLQTRYRIFRAPISCSTCHYCCNIDLVYIHSGIFWYHICWCPATGNDCYRYI